MIADISADAAAYNLMAGKARSWQQWITLFTGVAGAITGTEGLIAVVSDTEIPTWVIAISFVLNFMIAAAMVVLNVWDLGEVSAAARSAECSYNAVKNQLDTQLALSREKRRDPRELMQEVRDNMKSVQLSAPIVSLSLRRRAAALYIQFETPPETLIGFAETVESRIPSAERVETSEDKINNPPQTEERIVDLLNNYDVGINF